MNWLEEAYLRGWERWLEPHYERWGWRGVVLVMLGYIALALGIAFVISSWVRS